MTEIRVRIGRLALLFLLCGPFLAGPALALSRFVLTGETGVAAFRAAPIEPRAIVEEMLGFAVLWWAGTLSVVFGLITFVPTVTAGVVSGYVLRWLLSAIKAALKRTEVALVSALVCAACSAAVYMPVYLLLDRRVTGTPHPAVGWLAATFVGFMLGALAGAWPRIIAFSTRGMNAP